MKKALIVLSLLSISTTLTVNAAIDNNLKHRESGQDVTKLQEFLIENGFLSGSTTGFFGALTLKAVKSYQLSTKLPPTGFVGPATREKINSSIRGQVKVHNQEEKKVVANIDPVLDVCSNIDGVQMTVPVGMFSNGNNVCFTPTVSITQQDHRLFYSNTPHSVPVSPTASVPTTAVQSSKKNVEFTALREFSKHNDPHRITVYVYDDNGIMTDKYTPKVKVNNVDVPVSPVAPVSLNIPNNYFIGDTQLKFGFQSSIIVEIPELNLKKEKIVDNW